jgi:hypothetical protein
MYSTLSNPKGMTRTSSGEPSWLFVCLSSPIVSSVGTDTLRLTLVLPIEIQFGWFSLSRVGWVEKSYSFGACREETVALEAGFDKIVCCVFPAHSSSSKVSELVLWTKPYCQRPLD